MERLHMVSRSAWRRRLLATGAGVMLAAWGSAAGAQVAGPPAPSPVSPTPTAPNLPTTTQSADPAAPPALAGPAANTNTPPSGDQGGPDIVVTGSRITSAGFNAPTPTQVLGAAQLAKNAEPNIFTTVTQLPSLQGSTGATTNTNSTSSGQQGLSSFSLRGLGTIRTLTLLDGQRVVGANVTGVPDISQFPQLLVQRVDVVTGGASASYGSDAVGGVVNFITDKHFEGFKANAAGGLTTYGDDGEALLQAAAGKSFLDGRLHVEVSGEYDHQGGVPAGGFGEQMANGRHWYNTATLVNTGQTNNGSPQYLLKDHAQAYQYTKYGLITAGPLQGTAFDVNGRPFPFNYGSGGVPARNAAGTVNGCYVGFCVGGDLSGNVGIGTTLQSPIDRANGYGRVGFDFAPDNEIYATVNVAQVKSSNQPNPGASKTGLTIQCANPFVPAEVQQACGNAGITSFQYGTSNAILPNIDVHPTRKQYRFVGGADGRFGLLGTDWHYDTYYEHGINITDIHVNNILLNPHFNNAIQATTLNGQVVCANATARAAGCQPLNIIGGGAVPADTLSYVIPENGPFQHTRQTQDAFSASMSGEPLTLPSGPVSLAFGLEWRREAYKVVADPYGNGVSDDSPYSDAYPADPTVSTSGANWYAGNYHDGQGKYHVIEGFAEINVPFLKSERFGSANINAAGRVTNYSTSGTIWAWKVGGTWDTPIEGIRLRAVTSKDVRAPNLSELFAAPISVTVPNFTNPFTTPQSQLLVLQNTIGNSALKPETARNTELGVVLSHTPLLPGFSASFDYYRIRVNGVISTLDAQREVNLCYQGVTELCSAFNLAPASGTPYVNIQSFNLASIFTAGFDIEASYQMSLDRIGLPGRMTIRALATNVRHFITDPGIPGAVAIDTAGANSGNTPSWKLLGTETWDVGKFSFLMQQRWFSDGVFGNQYVVCSAGNCPVSTADHPTIDTNKMPGQFLFDIGGSYSLTKKLQIYAKVDNLFNKSPTGSPQTNTGIDVNQALYDTLGRFYHFGIRYNF